MSFYMSIAGSTYLVSSYKLLSCIFLEFVLSVVYVSLQLHVTSFYHVSILFHLYLLHFYCFYYATSFDPINLLLYHLLLMSSTPHRLVSSFHRASSLSLFITSKLSQSCYSCIFCNVVVSHWPSLLHFVLFRVRSHFNLLSHTLHLMAYFYTISILLPSSSPQYFS